MSIWVDDVNIDGSSEDVDVENCSENTDVDVTYVEIVDELEDTNETTDVVMLEVESTFCSYELVAFVFELVAGVRDGENTSENDIITLEYSSDE